MTLAAVSGTVAATDDISADGFLDAFMHGFEFALLAIRGRLQESDMEPAERARIEAFLADYARITRAYQARTPAPAPEGLAIQGRLPVELEIVARN